MARDSTRDSRGGLIATCHLVEALPRAIGQALLQQMCPLSMPSPALCRASSPRRPTFSRPLRR